MNPMLTLNEFKLYAGYANPETPDMAMRCPLCQEEIPLERHAPLGTILQQAATHLGTHTAVFDD